MGNVGGQSIESGKVGVGGVGGTICGGCPLSQAMLVVSSTVRRNLCMCVLKGRGQRCGVNWDTKKALGRAINGGGVLCCEVRRAL